MLIYDIVKKFIHDNEDVINSGDWYRLFESWYASANYQQHEEFTQLMKILETSNLTSWEETESIRVHILTKHILDYITKQQNNGNTHVTLAGTINNLRSKLGFSLREVRYLFERTCESQNLEKTGADKLRYKL